MAKYGSLFGIKDQARELKTEYSRAAGQGRSVTRFRQVYDGVPVLGGELNVQTTSGNELLVATGKFLPRISLDTSPKVSAQVARNRALAAISKYHKIKVGQLRATRPTLWVYDPAILDAPGAQVPRLVWRMDVSPAGVANFRELVLVDAKTGIVALHFNQIDTALNRSTYTANNTQTLPGTPVCTESDPTCSNGDADAKGAHINAGATYNFYKNVLGRDSIDGAGLPLISTVHYGSNYANAFWNGQQMVYGDAYGFPLADDVVGHELSHGVTQYESHLFYYYQSGAINESLSDVFGELIDLSDGLGNDSASVRWKLGEDITGLGAIRDMKNPPNFQQPDSMESSYYYGGSEDNGGVHTNSGVNNKAAYLITDGGTFNGQTVSGLGIDKTAKIYYEVQRNLLTSASDYQNLATDLPQACNDLVGTSGITSSDCQQVSNAVAATQMNQQPAAAPDPEAPVCASGQTPHNVFFDNLENPASGNWSKTGSWYYPQNPNQVGLDATYATSGNTNFWGYDQPNAGDYSITLNKNVSIPAGKTTYLRFNHSYGFDDDPFGDYDGGVVEYSVNGGPWQDLGPKFTNNGYDGTVTQYNGSGNPLAGRSAFVADSHGYISSRANLSSLAGKSVRFRFRIGTDSSVDDYGWFVDDVRLYTCGSAVDATPPNTTVIGGPSRTVRSTSATFGWSGSDNATPGTSLRYSYKLDGRPWSAFTQATSVKLTGLAQGRHTFQVRARDLAGNVDATPATRSWTIDTTKPAISNLAPKPASRSRDRTPTIGATVRDNIANLSKSNVKLYVNGKGIPASKFSYNRSTDRLVYTSPSLSTGKKTVKIIAGDAAGNTGSRSWYFTILR